MIQAAKIIGSGLATIGLILGVAINPSLRGQLFSYDILGFAFAEATGLFALMMAFLFSYDILDFAFGQTIGLYVSILVIIFKPVLIEVIDIVIGLWTISAPELPQGIDIIIGEDYTKETLAYILSIILGYYIARLLKRPRVIVQLALVPVQDNGFIEFCIIDLLDPSGINLRTLYHLNTELIGEYINYRGQIVYAFFEDDDYIGYEIYRQMIAGIDPSSTRTFYSNPFPAPIRWHWLHLILSTNFIIYTGTGIDVRPILPTLRNVVSIEVDTSPILFIPPATYHDRLL